MMREEVLQICEEAREKAEHANLRDANLRDANLTGANLTGAKNIPAIVAARLMVPPQEGAFIAYKKCKESTYGKKVIVKLQIPKDAKRSSATTRKCRASKAKVLEIYGSDVAYSMTHGNLEYKVGETVKADKWDEDRWNECSGGIHFFMTREEAEAYT